MAKRGFTLVEVLVTVVLVGMAVTGVMSGIRAIVLADAKTRSADLLQRLASEKMSDLAVFTDPSTADMQGDFSDRGYADIRWTVTVQASGTANVDQVTVDATRGADTQTLTKLVYVPPAATATGSTP